MKNHICLFLCILIFGVPSLSFSQITYVDSAATGVNDGSSWTTAYKDLQDALATAQSGDSVWVAKGTYHPTPDSTNRDSSFSIPEGVILIGGFAGTETSLAQRMTDSVSLHETYKTTLSGNIGDLEDSLDNSYHVVKGGQNAVLDGFTVSDGNANKTEPYGGGMMIVGTSPTVKNCVFYHNTAGQSGGGIYITGNVNPVFTNCYFLENTASMNGGGIGIDGGDPIVSYSTFSENEANHGGAVYNSAANPSFSFCTFGENHSFFSGGGMWNTLGSKPTLLGCTFWGNRSDSLGGGMGNFDNCKPILMNCTFSGNSSYKGGAMYNENSLLDAVISGCTFYQNIASLGGGIYQEGASSIFRNTLVASNSGRNIFHETSLEFIRSEGHNFMGDTTGANLQFMLTDILGSASESIDPMLDVLGNYGGPTLTHSPLPGSPVLGTGETTGSTAIAKDQRGFSRITGSGRAQIDIGAVEWQSTYVTAPVRSICIGDDDFAPLGTILIQDSTGGAFAIEENVTMTFVLSEGIRFQPDSGSVGCDGEGLEGCAINMAEDSFTITYTRSYNTMLNTIWITDVYIKADSSFRQGDFILYRTGGNAQQLGNQPQDRVPYAKVLAVPTIRLVDKPYDNSFEKKSDAWVISGDNPSWEWGTPNGEIINYPASGKKVLMTSLDLPYPAGEASSVTSPCFDFTGVENPLVGVSIWVDTEEGFDGAVLQSSIDAGDTWQTVGSNQRGVEWYNSATLVANPGDQDSTRRYGWTGRDTAWRRALIKLEDVVDDVAVQFRMAFSSIPFVDTTQTNDGFAFDNFFIGENTKNILLEHYTDQSLEKENDSIRAISWRNTLDLIPIQFHITEEDPYYESSPAGPRTRALYYGISEPGLVVVEGDGFLGPVGILTQEVLDQQILSESGMVISFDTTDNIISFTSLWGFDDELIVYTAVVENTSSYKNLFRAFLPDPGGSSFSVWPQGGTKNLSFTWEADAVPSPSIVEHYDSLNVLVWVQDRQTKEIFQVAISTMWTGLLDPSILRKGAFPPAESQVSIYPNPVRENVFVSFQKETNSEMRVQLRDMKGKTLYSHNLAAGEKVYQLEVAFLPSGMYHLQVASEDAIILREKVVVIR